MVSKKMKIFIAGLVATFVIVVGAAIYLIHQGTTASKSSLASKTISNPVSTKSNDNINSENNDKKKKEVAPPVKTTPQSKQVNKTKQEVNTSPVLNTTINTNENKSVKDINYPSLFQSTFGYQYTYPQMVGNKDINFLKSLTLFQLAQMKEMIPYTATTIKNRTSLNEYMQQLKQLESNTNTLLSMVTTLQKNSTDSNYINLSNQFININSTILTDLASEIGSMNLFNSGYGRLNTLPFGVNMQQFVNQLNGLNTSLGTDNTAATTWLSNASNTFVMYQGPLAPTNEVKISSSTSIKQQ